MFWLLRPREARRPGALGPSLADSASEPTESLQVPGAGTAGWGPLLDKQASWFSQRKDFIFVISAFRKGSVSFLPSRQGLLCRVKKGAGGRSQQARGTLPGEGVTGRSPAWTSEGPGHGRGDGGHVRCLSAHRQPPGRPGNPPGPETRMSGVGSS